jgi:DNA polymerase-4
MYPFPTPPPTILHLDADAFFASIEQRDDPRLRGRPVAVGTGVVASCSYEARRYGVRTAMRLSEARQRCRPLIVVPGAYARYELVGRQLLALCRDQTPVVEAAALDDFYLDLTKCAGTGERAARGLREQVREEVRISISVGVGTSKLIARIATDDAKPGGQVCVAAGGERAYLAPRPVGVLPGVGPRTEAVFHNLNVARVADVAAMPPPLLRRLFGVRGRQFHEHAHGHDLSPVQPHRRPQSISRRTSFEPPVSDPAHLAAMLDYLLERAARWLRCQDLAAQGVTLTLCYGDDQVATGRERLPEPARRDDVLGAAARECFARLYTRRLPLRLLGVDLTALTPAVHQAELFPDADDERRQRLSACKDAIRQRYGFLSLVSGTTLTLKQSLPHDRQSLHLRTPCLTR